MTECYLEIDHSPFNDGTPRHPLVSIKIQEDDFEKVYNILMDCSECYEDKGYDLYEIHPNSPREDWEYKENINYLFEKYGIVGSIWVEYYLKIK